MPCQYLWKATQLQNPYQKKPQTTPNMTTPPNQTQPNTKTSASAPAVVGRGVFIPIFQLIFSWCLFWRLIFLWSHCTLPFETASTEVVNFAQS